MSIFGMSYLQNDHLKLISSNFFSAHRKLRKLECHYVSDQQMQNKLNFKFFLMAFFIWSILVVLIAKTGG
jgi:hypothetical protein